MRHNRVAQAHRAQQRQLQRLLPLLNGKREEAAGRRTAGVDYKNVNLPEALDGCRHHSDNISGHAYIAADGQHLCAGGIANLGSG